MKLRKISMAYHTDVGITKKTNQDSLLIQGISNGSEEIAFAVICDGMGGMQKGELASAYTVRCFSEWFLNEYAQGESFWENVEIKKSWRQLFNEINHKLITYGMEKKIQLGTTATVVLLDSQGRYLIGHIGDTRVYYLGNHMEQLTEDHSFVAREIKKGTMTPEQAKKDSRRNVLLQCIGINERINPQFLEGTIDSEEMLLMCTDGFRHVVSDEEIYEVIHSVSDVVQTKQRLIELTELNKDRMETDNISTILLQLR